MENTDFLQAVTLLTTLKRRTERTPQGRPPAVGQTRGLLLKLALEDYLKRVDPLREAFVGVGVPRRPAHLRRPATCPTPKQLVPLAAIKVVLGGDADLHGVRQHLSQWFWCGILGELYGSAIETRFARDMEQVPDWAPRRPMRCRARSWTPPSPNPGCSSLRTRNAAAYKGIYAPRAAHGARDWMEDKALDKVQHSDLAVDIHHVFPQKWCNDNGIDDEQPREHRQQDGDRRQTNRTIGGSGPSDYLPVIERNAQIGGEPDGRTRCWPPPDRPGPAAPADDFDAFFDARWRASAGPIEEAMGKAVQRDDAVITATSGPPSSTPRTPADNLADPRRRRKLEVRPDMAISNRDRIDRMFQVMAPALDDFIASVIGQGDPALGAAWMKLVQAKDAKNGANPGTRPTIRSTRNCSSGC